MIDTTTGYIKFNDQLTVSPLLEFDKLNNQTNGTNKTYSNMKTGWEWLNLKNIKSGHNHLSVQLGFENKKLKQVSFVFHNTLENQPLSFEAKRQKEYEAWLTHQIGKQRSFKWGEVQAFYDPKACFSSILIRYKTL